jgi:hypothetical protein
MLNIIIIGILVMGHGGGGGLVQVEGLMVMVKPMVRVMLIVIETFGVD